MTRPVPFNLAAWRNLCDVADRASLAAAADPWGRIAPECVRAADELPLLAGRLTTITPPNVTMAQTCLVNAFRWTCCAYGRARPEARRALAPGLRVMSAMIRELIEPAPPPSDAAATAAPAPAPLIDDDPRPEAQPRRDVFG